MPEEQNEFRSVPLNDLDLNLRLTNSSWGLNSEISPELKEKLSKYWIQTDEEGKQFINKKSLWGELSFLTRDLRLANLSEEELIFVRYHLDLAGDMLNCDYIEPFLIAISRVASVLETSQSKKGFLRKAMNTLRQETYKQEIEPPKKSFFGGNKGHNNYGGY